jgi:hypothetical protein
LDTRIKGSDLILMQKNYNNKMSKLWYIQVHLQILKVMNIP